jgi:hypothetical protein
VKLRVSVDSGTTASDGGLQAGGAGAIVACWLEPLAAPSAAAPSAAAAAAAAAASAAQLPSRPPDATVRASGGGAGGAAGHRECHHHRGVGTAAGRTPASAEIGLRFGGAGRLSHASRRRYQFRGGDGLLVHERHARTERGGGAEALLGDAVWGASIALALWLRGGEAARSQRARGGPVLTEIHLCHPCSCPETEVGNATPPPPRQAPLRGLEASALELGAGVGLPGLSLGACEPAVSSVVLTDAFTPLLQVWLCVLSAERGGSRRLAPTPCYQRRVLPTPFTRPTRLC